jgi:hypothetical protein
VRQRPSELRCVDVEEHCVKRIGPDDVYVALSNVWSHQIEPRIRSHNVEEFSSPGAFARTELPRTIEDAIEVTRALGYRYLWVASLCILQDRMAEKIALIETMDAIYGNADLTIIEASGSTARNGLEGWAPDKRANRKLAMASIGQILRVGVLPLFNEQLKEAGFVSRAWTYVKLSFSVLL